MKKAGIVKGTAELRAVVDGPASRQLHQLMRALAGKGRFRIIMLLKTMHGALNVTEIGTILGMSTSSVSHDLRVLRRMGLVKSSTKGREVLYSTNGAFDKLRLII
jgi:DNA-binding transcriptional ArsR family regulator